MVMHFAQTSKIKVKFNTRLSYTLSPFSLREKADGHFSFSLAQSKSSSEVPVSYPQANFRKVFPPKESVC